MSRKTVVHEVHDDDGREIDATFGVTINGGSPGRVAMQKVVGSSPIIRSSKPPETGAFL